MENKKYNKHINTSILRREMNKKGLKLEHLQDLGYSTTTAWRYLNDKTNMSVDFLIDMLDIFGLEFDDVIIK